MEANKYQELALRTASSYNREDLLMNGALGLAGESGEVADMVKKYKFQGHSLDEVELALELGDICWYVAITAKSLGYSLEDIMRMNVEKLKKRYPGGFSAYDSLHREENK